MMRIMAKPSNRFLKLCAVSCFALTAPAVYAQAPAAPVNPLQKLYDEAEKAFAANDFPTVAAKLEELIKQGGEAEAKNDAMERVRFNLGFAYLLSAEKDAKPESPYWAKAEAAFDSCAKAFPKHEFTSRCYLGIGRARVGQGKLSEAVDPLRRASADIKYRTEAGIVLGNVYKQLKRNDEALKVFSTLMGSEVISAEQATASIKAVEVLADSNELAQLARYLERLSTQPGIIDLSAAYANELVRIGDGMMDKNPAAALLLYRSVQPRHLIIEQQRSSMERIRKDLDIVKKFVDAKTQEAAKAPNAGLGNQGLLEAAKSAAAKMEALLKAQEESVKMIEEKDDMDASLMMRRGRALYQSKRYSEARVCFREIRTKFAKSGELETASFAELATLNDMNELEELKKLAAEFLKNFPDSARAETVVGIVGNSLVGTGDWPKVEKFFTEAKNKYPNSPEREGYMFAEAMAVMQQGRFADARGLFEDIIRTYPSAKNMETVLYYITMTWFFDNKQNKTVEAAENYLKKYPKGTFAGDMRYRLAFIQYQDTKNDYSDVIIDSLTKFLQEQPNDVSAGSIWCLLGDVYSKKANQTNLPEDQVNRYQENAIEAYKKAVWSQSPDDVIQYALETATQLLRDRKDWNGIADLHGEFLTKKPNHELALMSALQVAKMRQREGKIDEAVELLGTNLAKMIGDPANEQVEPLIDQIVQLKVPRKKAAEIDKDAVEKDVEAVMTKIIGENKSPTTVARTFYAKSRVREALRDKEKANMYMVNMANTTEADALSPVLLARCADILLAKGDLDRAESFYKRLTEKYEKTSYSDAGPVGLGYIELKRNSAATALNIFNEVIEKNNGTSRYKEAVLGKIQAMVKLNQLDAAEKLANESVGNKEFKGLTAAQIYLELITIKEKRADGAAGDAAKEFLKEAHAYAQRTYTAYKAFPEVAIPAYTKAIELLGQIGESELQTKTQAALDAYKASLEKK